MVTVEEAFRIIGSIIAKVDVEDCNILASVGRALAEPVLADRDFPPFSRVSMDGIAIDVGSFKNKNQRFLIENVQAAGSPPSTLKDKSACIEVMTGAVLPINTNAVIRYEDLELKDGTAQVKIDQIEKGMNIHAQGKDAKRGDQLLKPGQVISAAEVAVLASVGKESVRVFAFPKTAVVSSGDELVEIADTPQPHQIRKSNTHALQAAMFDIGWKAESFHLLDDRELVKKNLRTILENDNVIILSGGVSKGKFDFIPEALEELGIEKLFHQVSQRPGKPFWFGASSDRSRIVFALPGNPVSTFLCYHKYIKPWILKSFGVEQAPITARLTADVNFAIPLTYFLQVRAEIKNGEILAHPYAGGGSGDFANLKDVDGFLELPLDKTTFRAGESYPFISFRV
ncbi:MAG TPA: molybdopterin molybdotransferase MoeA [Cyclobacteriaceae bacterium]|nr:molybdopterin molybdotransferase MoeA [Cyclobacteriaceae bacterium]